MITLLRLSQKQKKKLLNTQDKTLLYRHAELFDLYIYIYTNRWNKHSRKDIIARSYGTEKC